ncbi:RdgB/HAM1 family non-canonical purine NTP pyrophosphatase [Amphritea sp. 2_MG-2023]|jgi:XTP/dITP diphosphohydrolase|uniref:RdgB/HAM1 family non-canonical purine NTP pyrophosphatase n=1 Tax=Amphritea TaxID=515417 RepID=UPI001C067FB7|nr:MULTISPECIES: RdgB/HAM1 family non-canonical purine NTP pyrophosphatase [Amphritea]MBU2965655.1 RdgB/HAM1 family non-canonical purine NTP pyrophosphatase [Amphritea atlantica]MDO6417211.1 RdgB/HAM1 family non-canonical purine NTP pyrophosphatase [Amphritea sp. 2_MG-2023]MDX2423319.1 RdgB/HAM1 family non-canonical purine NTP pyrophosphatase [Amphritea sp.]
MTRQIVLASGNKGKLKEFNQVLGDLGVEVVPQSQFNVPDADETGLSFVENAIIKARHACQLTGLPALADDSGLEVDALNGAPGIYSARFAGAGATDAKNNQKLLQLLEGTSPEQRSARFRCVLVFMRHAEDPTPLICQGSWEGQILPLPQGDNGFGYDPLFLVPGLDIASAQLPPEQKNKISHRGQAVQQLIQLIPAYL